ncbi:hypothetical protein BH10CHL1_BH10CHL1_46660 [soil metagenome]
MRKLAETLYAKNEASEAYTLAAIIADVVEATGKPEFYGATQVGACPFCGDCEELLCSAGKNYAVCHEHRVYWYIGADYLALCHDTDELASQNQALLHSYAQISTKEAFPSDVCPCCGLFIMHSRWCIIPVSGLDETAPHC